MISTRGAIRQSRVSRRAVLAIPGLCGKEKVRFKTREEGNTVSTRVAVRLAFCTLSPGEQRESPPAQVTASTKAITCRLREQAELQFRSRKNDWNVVGTRQGRAKSVQTLTDGQGGIARCLLQTRAREHD